MSVPHAEKLDTIQKENKLNDVYSIDEIGPGGAHHKYQIMKHDKLDILQEISFQKGPRKEDSSVHGVLDPDLLEIVRDRLRAFQAGPFACEENEKALHHVEEALKYMNERVENRAKRGVLGTNTK